MRGMINLKYGLSSRAGDSMGHPQADVLADSNMIAGFGVDALVSPFV